LISVTLQLGRARRENLLNHHRQQKNMDSKKEEEKYRSMSKSSKDQYKQDLREVCSSLAAKLEFSRILIFSLFTFP